jgi:hypothetical protein
MGVGHTYLPPLLLRVDEREEASIGREDSRLTLQGWLRGWETLERENAELRSKVAMLEGSAKSLSRKRYLEEDELGASELDER